MSRVFIEANMCFNAIPENKILTKISEFTVIWFYTVLKNKVLNFEIVMGSTAVFFLSEILLFEPGFEISNNLAFWQV